MRTDDIDERIIALLEADARSSFATIGEQVGLSAPAVKRRVDRLRAAGIILGFTTTIATKHLGWTIEAFVEIFCEGKVSPDRLRVMTAAIPQLRAAYTVTGDADAMLQVVAADMADFERVLERVRDHPGVAKTRSTVVLSRL